MSRSEKIHRETGVNGPRLSIAILGCGAVTEQCHLPALLKRHDCEVVALVDSSRQRVQELSARHKIPYALTDYRELEDLAVDAAVVALPNYLHAPVTIDLLRRGTHVLVEKPMALTLSECDAMIEAAEQKQVVLAVGLMRRFYRSGQLTSSLVRSGALGRINSFDLREGRVLNWPMASDFFFRRNASGGGVLIDIGVHVLDQILWWLGDADSFEYYDDNFGGVEADCEIHLKLKSGAQGIVELSRTRRLRNTAIIRGEHGELEVSLTSNHVAWRLKEAALRIVGHAAGCRESIDSQNVAMNEFAAEHDDFVQAIREGCSPLVCGLEGKKSLALIEACYRQRQPLKVPWMDAQPEQAEEIVR